MKTKKYHILVLVSLVAIVGLAGQTDGEEKPSLQRRIQRGPFLQGVLFARDVTNDGRIAPLNLKSNWGIQEVEILVEKLPQEAERYGLTRQALQTDTELRLRQRGVKVVTRQEMERRRVQRIVEHENVMNTLKDLILTGEYEKALKQMKEPYKSLIGSLDEESDERFYQCLREYVLHSEHSAEATLYVNVNVDVNEERGFAVYSISVELVESAHLTKNQYFSHATFWQRRSVGYTPLSKLRDVRESVRYYVDEFINEYLAANPTKGLPVSPPATKATQKGLISAIVYSEDSPAAVIGNSIVHEGDTVGSVTVVKIHKDKIEFEKKGKDTTVKWTQKIGEAPKPHWE